MNDIVIEQAIAHRSGSDCRILAKSSGVLDDWQGEIERLSAGFGERPAGLVCPGALFAQPFTRDHVAVVQVADQGSDEGGRPLVLGFHFLIIPADAYRNLWGDPFALADRVAPAWHVRGSLPVLYWPAEPLPPRTVQQVQDVLKRTKSGALPEDEDVPPDWDQRDLAEPEQALSPALLGGVQVLVDGGRLVFERPGPDTELLRGLWTLLPTSTRFDLWPATFAFSNALGFEAIVVPPGVQTGPAAESEFAGYTTEDQACDYPQGSYELNLQIAAESGNQADLDKLLARRSWGEAWRLALTLLVVLAVLALALNFFQAPQPKPEPQPTPARRAQASIAAGVVGMTSPWQTLTLLPAARQTWNQISKEDKDRP